MASCNGMEWIFMEVSRIRSGRLSGKKNYPFTLLHGPLSARGERQSHPLAGQAQACGRPTQGGGAGGPDGTCRGHWLIPLLKKKKFDSCMSSLRLSMLFFSVSLQAKTLEIMFVVLAQGPCWSSSCRHCQPSNHYRFVHGRQASILVLESLRSRRAECHLRSRAIPADDSHALPFFEEILESSQTQGSLRLNLAHRHPISTIFTSSPMASKTMSKSSEYGSSHSLSPSDAS